MRHLFFRISIVSASLFLLPLSNLITTPIISRLLGPQGKGELVLILQPMTIVDSIAIMGISSYLISQSRLDNKASKKQSDLFSPQIIGNCLGLLLLTIWYQVSISSKVGNSQLVVICYALLPFGTWIAIHKTRLIINGSLRPVIFETLTNAALRIFMILVYNFLEVEDPALIALSFILIGILSGMFCIRPPSIRKQILKFNTGKLKQFAPPNPSLWLFDILSIASVRLDLILLSIIYSKSQIGIYSVALVVAEIPLFVSNSVSRELINIKRKIRERGRYFMMTAEITFLSVCVLVYGSSQFIPVVFGEQFKEAVFMSQLLIISTFFQMHSQLISTYMLINGLASKRYPLYLCPLFAMIIGIFLISFFNLKMYTFIVVIISGWILSFFYGLLTIYFSRKSARGMNENI